MKICYLFLICSTLSSCAVTQSMWIARQEGIKVAGFFIDHERKKVVLVSRIDRDKPSEHYSLSDPSGDLIKSFEIGLKSSGIISGFNQPGIKAKGSAVYSESFSVTINKKNLSLSQVEQMQELGFQDDNFIYPDEILNSRFQEQTTKDRMRYMNANNGFMMSRRFYFKPMATRYPSSKETFKNFCSETNNDPNCSKITKFEKPWQDVIQNLYTIPEKALRIAVTPFTVAADILLTPLYLVGFIGMGISDGAGNVDPRVPQSTNSK